MSKRTKKTGSIDPTLTLAQLSELYIKNLEREGRSLGTAFSYALELRTARAELGEDVLVSALTAEDVERFNRCARVTKLRGGKKPKSQLSIDKTRRVLRLALAFGEQHGLIEKSPIPAKGEPTSAEVEAAAPAKKARKPRVVVEAREPVEAAVEEPSEPAVAENLPRKRVAFDMSESIVDVGSPAA